MEVSWAMQPGKYSIVEEATALDETYVIITSQDVPGLTSKNAVGMQSEQFRDWGRM